MRMKRTRTSIAIVAILVLIAAALLPGGTAHAAVLPVAMLLVALTLTFKRLWAAPIAIPSGTLERALTLLRAPPASSMQR